MQFVNYGMQLFVRFMIWSFTKAWPVGMGLLVGGLFNFLRYESLSLIAFVLCILGGYAFIYRDYLFPPKE